MRKPGPVEIPKQPGKSTDRTSLTVVTLRRILRTHASLNDSNLELDRRARAEECIRRLEQALVSSPELPLTLDVMAQLLHLEKTHCSKVLRQVTGRTLPGLLRKYRINKAQELLRIGKYTVTAVGEAVGYVDPTTFGKNFRRELGTSPTEYRRSGANGDDPAE